MSSSASEQSSEWEDDGYSSCASEGEIVTKKLNRRLQEHLDSQESSGYFLARKHFTAFPLPVIKIEGIGSVMAPLSHESAARLREVSHKAKFGYRGETRLDLDVRDTWELHDDQFNFENEHWESWFSELVNHLAVELGVHEPSAVTAERHKLLLYDKGAKFKAHRDTEKKPGMFATLAVVLPTKHTGGCLRARLAQQEESVDTGTTSAFGLTAMAWYSDVSHEIEPIESGSRLVATYNLIYRGRQLGSLANRLTDQRAKLHKILHFWSTRDPSRPAVFYGLAHRYLDTAHGLQGLKRTDFANAKYLVDACRDTEFVVLIANMELHENYMNDEGGEDEKESHLRLENIVTPNGAKMGGQIHTVHQEYHAGLNLYRDRNPDEETGGDYLGNQHDEKNRYYRDTALVIVREECMATYWFGGLNTRSLEAALDCLGGQTGDALILRLFERVCRLFLAKSTDKEGYAGAVARVALRQMDWALFTSALKESGDGFDDSTYQTLAWYVSQDRSVLEKPETATSFNSLKIHRSWERLQAFSKATYSSKSLTEIDYWIECRMASILDEADQACDKDVNALIQYANTIGEERFVSSIKPIVLRSADNTGFVNQMLFMCIGSQPGSSNAAKLLVPLVLDKIVSCFDMTFFDGQIGHDKGAEKAAETLAALCRVLVTSEYSGGTPGLLEKIKQQIKEKRDHFVIHLLHQLCSVLDVTKHTQDFFKAFLTDYARSIVGMEPTLPSDWDRSSETNVHHNCHICLRVNVFLKSSTEEDAVFPVLGYDTDCCIGLRPSLKIVKREPKQYLVKKTLGGFKEAHGDWLKRFDSLRKEIAAVPEDQLRPYLQGSYEEIVTLQDLLSKQDKESKRKRSSSDLQDPQRRGHGPPAPKA